ncbi:hypothetical protein JG687_00017501 [Phytophthora cactorum]|uniref:NADP-dependent oxidoreductase domain-containing protein n=2 Tax=Phytophthora cactorum TaxID=29920 RepID=A0A8T1TPT5_9STRA|nr:NADP-dependent oxidoreductase domain [Phytophthora cactorum]KAG2775739.1 putative voltage-gated potassium channel subunit beta [Phytophthora cactorum]KAG2999419.1 putative voltage-gated potassium channel subunit beta [Phytophthora cactorum]KAG3049300.1 putative voltage-gated potassium channel subunit beta [Phytophthora cactorum]KAG4043125.1 putative voltage-gated potassium channel subunit beta [Phytophthora cactorum]
MAPSTVDSTSSGMTYRFLGNSGLLVSKLGLGSWMEYGETKSPELWYEIMKTAFEHGVNLFDNADSYGVGLGEEYMGAAIKMGIKDGTWKREDLVLTTKLGLGTKGFHGGSGPNDQGLTRKHIVEGLKASLKRMDLDYVDVLFCIRPDQYTPLEETVRAMNYIIERGWAFYWGTSQWPASRIMEACEIADRLGLIRPVVEQPIYNMLNRSRVDHEYLHLYKKYKLGLTTWAPLSSGILTGKHSNGTVKGTRMDIPVMKAFVGEYEQRVANADKLKPVAEELGVSLLELAIAWCVSNQNVSTVLIAARNLTQLKQNLKALSVVEKITPEVKAKIDTLVPFVPEVAKPDWTENIRTKFL